RSPFLSGRIAIIMCDDTVLPDKEQNGCNDEEQRDKSCNDCKYQRCCQHTCYEQQETGQYPPSQRKQSKQPDNQRHCKVECSHPRTVEHAEYCISHLIR